jgi:hypothetical protein
MSSISQNLTENQPWPSQDTILAAHGRICDEYGRLEQLRSSLLTSIPGVTALLSGASIFIGVANSNPQLTHFLSVLGVLGMFTCLGLYYREVEYEVEIISLEDQLTTYEKKLKIANTLYTSTPRSPHKLLKKEHSAILLYSSSFTAWYCVATWFILPDFPGTKLSWALILVPFVMLGIVFAMWEIRHTRISSLPQDQQHLQEATN